MKNTFDNRELEQFLQQNANQYRMYPSEKVWRGIYTELHGRRKWYGYILLFLSLLIISSISVSLVKTKPPASQNQVAAYSQTIANTLSEPPSAPVAENLIPYRHPGRLTSSSETITGNISYPAISASVLNPEAVSFSQKATDSDVELISFTDKPGLAPLPVNMHKESFSPVDLKIHNPVPADMPDRVQQFIPGNEHDLNDTKKQSERNSYPWTMESSLHLLRPVSKKKVTILAYFTPAISYRKLRGNNSFINAANNPSPSGVSAYYDVNNAVFHKPALGLELGLSARYPVFRAFHLTGGLQVNVNRYDIRAFSHSGEVAKIALDQGQGISSLYTWSNYRNFSGYSTNWLQNYYFSISAPVGGEITFGGNNNRLFGLSGTVQPTYIIHNRAFLITTDYKNYAQIPWLIRRWNMNASMEAFIKSTAGKIRWQAGPQIRYQLLSSFHNKYPVKENLYEFGLKVGIMLNH